MSIPNTACVQSPGYSGHFARHPDPDAFHPFDPDPAGALREALAFISNPAEVMSPPPGQKGGWAKYHSVRIPELVAMLQRAITNAEKVAA